MTKIDAARAPSSPARACIYTALALLAVAGCAPGSSGPAAVENDPGVVTGEFVTYVADYKDGHSEWWHAVRTTDGHEMRLDFDVQPSAATGNQVRLHGEAVGDRFHVNNLEVLPKTVIAAEGAEPELIAAPAQDTFALVLVDLGSGVNLTAAQGLKDLFSTTPADKSFASYYNESSYGKYQVSGDVIGPYTFSMTTCDTTGMYQAIEPMITGTYNHLIYYFNETSLCDFGGLGEEGNSLKPAKRTWMNGSLSCVVLMQEPGHNLGLMHANTMKCGTDSFSTTPVTSCTITEYGSSMSTMGGGCKQFNAYERWYMQWLTGCNGVRVPASGTFNLLPLENTCSGGSGVQVLQVPFPATLTVHDPQATTQNVNLNNYYVELRTAGGIFDAFGTTGRGGGSSVTFTAPTVFIYTSDNVRVPTTSTGRGGGTTQQNSVWTELLNMTPSGTAFTGLTTAGQTFTDPAGGPTITLTSISATGATITVSNPSGTGSPTCIDGTTLTAPGPTSCVASGVDGGAPTTGAGGTTGAAGTTGTTTGAAGTKGAAGTTGTTGAGGAKGTTTGTAGTSGTTITGAAGTPGTTGAAGGTGTAGGSGVTTGAGGAPIGGGTTGEATTVSGGCSCSFESPTASNSGLAWLSLGGLSAMLTVSRRRRKRTP
jgi:hypothetical protein